MDHPEAPGREAAAAVQNKPEMLEQCPAVIEQMGQEPAQLHEQVSALLDARCAVRTRGHVPVVSWGVRVLPLGQSD